MTREQLQEKSQKLLHDMRALNDLVLSEKRAMSTDEQTKYDAMDADFDKIRAEIKRLEKLEENERFMNEPINKIGFDSSDKKEDDEANKYKRAFFDYVKGSEFEKRDLSAGVNTDGGYTVPVVYHNQIIEKLQKTTLMRQLASVMQTTSTTKIPLGTTIPEFGWIDEKGTYPNADTKFDQITLDAFKFGGIVKITEELLQDSAINIENYVMRKISEGMGYHEENAFIGGNGVKKPTGIKNAPIGITTASSTAIAADEIIDMFYSLNQRYRTNAKWLISDDFEKAIRKLKDTTGQYIWQPGLSLDKPATILNKPVYNSEFMDALGEGLIPAIFGDLKYYQIADRGNMSIQRLNELYAGTGQVGFRVNKRIDGKLTLDSAVRTLKCA